MADTSVDNKSTNENGTKESSEESSKTDIEKEENLKNAESDKAASKSIIDKDDRRDTSDKNSETAAVKGIAVPASASSSSCPSISFTKDEGTKLNHTSSPLRPSMWGGGSSSGSGTASTSLFGSSSICSPVFSSCSSSSSSSSNSFPRNLFAKSNLSSSPWPVINRSPALHKPVLRPSQLAATPGSSGSSSTDTPSRSNPFVLNPPKLANPFAKTPAKDATSDDEPAGLSSEGSSGCKRKKSGSPTISSTINIQESVETSSAAGQQGKQQELDNTKSSSNNTNVSTSVTTSSSLPVSFVPLSAPPGSTQSTPIRLPSSSSSTHTPGTSSTPSFVFGQNLHERVIVEPSGSQAGTSSSSDLTVPFHDGAIPSTANAVAATNGTSTEMLFTSVIQKELPDKNPEGNGSTDDKSKKSLSESAREYEESRAVKRKYEEVTVVTGEEEENNILQMDCKLFVYDGSKFNYSEGVHGSLRVNDPPVTAKKVTQSRVIVRMSGTLRVLMNTKIWAGMKIEKPNRKIVRMTAMDSVGQIKVFLISSSPSESDMLYRVLESRIKLQKELTGGCQNGTDTDSSKPESSQ